MRAGELNFWTHDHGKNIVRVNGAAVGVLQVTSPGSLTAQVEMLNLARHQLARTRSCWCSIL